jgi:MFS transporter, NNP family, nitrate/nitrite transporter
MDTPTQKRFLKTGHWPTLLAAFIYFDFNFMCWVMLGPMSIQIARNLQLDALQRGLMVATPMLSGTILQIITGVLVDHFGAKRVGIVTQSIVILGLGAAWFLGVPDFTAIILVGIILGLAGASFSVALPLVSRWYPAAHQGKALGLAGAGSFGFVITALLAPWLGLNNGWVNVFAITALFLIIVLLIFAVLAKDSPDSGRQAFWGYWRILGSADSWWFMLFYWVTFGGFVGLASYLSLYFHTLYGMPPIQAGYVVALCVFLASLFRPIGGWLADKFGGVRILFAVNLLSCVILIALGVGPQAYQPVLVEIILLMIVLGIGNGAVFQLVPVRFSHEIGAISGLVGCAGGLGGFFLAASLGYSRQYTGSYQGGFLIFSGISLLALAGLHLMKARWQAGIARSLKSAA